MKKFKDKIRHIIFEASDPPSRLFDLILLWAILVSVVVVMLDSVQSLPFGFHEFLYIIEWVLTILFTIEYLLRIWVTNKALKYVFSFYGIIDLLAVLPTYISIFLAGSQYLLVIRILRLLRIFRILKLVGFVKEARVLIDAIMASRHKLIVFLGFLISLDVIIGTMMYMIEGPENGFTSIPFSIYWAIVTMTTVGYGDIAPHTILGQSLASIVMLLGYTIIAIPTGIVSVSLFNKDFHVTTRACPNCSKDGHDKNAVYCKFCGHIMS